MELPGSPGCPEVICNGVPLLESAVSSLKYLTTMAFNQKMLPACKWLSCGLSVNAFCIFPRILKFLGQPFGRAEYLALNLVDWYIKGSDTYLCRWEWCWHLSTIAIALCLHRLHVQMILIRYSNSMITSPCPLVKSVNISQNSCQNRLCKSKCGLPEQHAELWPPLGLKCLQWL